MFHSVGLEDDRYWPMVNISEPMAAFRDKLEILKAAGYEFWHWDKLYSYVRHGSARSKPAIMLTFDDGYLDNWVYVFRILKELDVKATIFVNPDFVDPRTEPRPTYEDVLSGKVAEAQLEKAGFLSWAEMRAMEASGLVDIQSHTQTHTWYFNGPKLLDFHHPNSNRYPWQAWNYRPDQKPFYMTADQASLVPWGTPVYEHEKALICRRYFPPEEVASRICEFVSGAGGAAYFDEAEWRRDLREMHDGLMREFSRHARYETDEEYEERIMRELAGSKAIIERELGKSVEYVCWPGGGYNEAVLAAAKRVGYRAWTLASSDQTETRNRAGGDPGQVKRMSSCAKYVSSAGTDCGYAGKYFFLSNVARHKGSAAAKWIARALRQSAVVRHWVTRGLAS
jgi:peptidoglycan/xylan/chitin deacetylase (PgdA/CDA1 family)